MKIAHILVCHSTDPSKAIESIPHRPGALWYVFLHSRNQTIEEKVHRRMAERNGNVFDYRENRGLARSWNEGLHLSLEASCDATFLLNDDLFFYPRGYDAFVEVVATVKTLSRNVAYVTTMGKETGSSPHAGQILAQQFACCVIMPECEAKIGYFDETFVPAYYEDLDYDRRARLAGMTMHVHPEVIVEHERSSTHQSMSTESKKEIESYIDRNKQYYHQKWGPDLDYLSPFDRPDIGLKIDFSARRAPYDTPGLPPDASSDEWDRRLGRAEACEKPGRGEAIAVSG